MEEEWDRERLEAWLEDKPREIAVVVAARAALRAAPFLAVDVQKNSSKKRQSLLTLSVFRCILTSSVSAVKANGQVMEAARIAANTSVLRSASKVASSVALAGDAAVAAADAAYALNASASANAAIASVEAAAFSAFVDAAGPSAASRAAAAYLKEIAADIYLLLEGGPDDLVSNPLWAKPDLKVSAGFDQTLIDWLSTTPGFAFWLRWYGRENTGGSKNWDMQREIALISDEVWEEGPEAVAVEIERIELKYRSAVSRRLVEDENTGVLREERPEDGPVEPLRFACNRIDLALKAALAAGGTNGLRDDSYETIVIRGVAAEHMDDGSLLAVAFYDACMGLQKNIGDVYPEDAALLNLKNALYATVEELCELDPIIRARVELLVKLGVPSQLTSEDRESALEVPEKVEDQLDPEAFEKLKSDAKVIAEQQNPPRNVRARFTNWVTTISLWMDRAKKGEQRVEWLAKFVDKLAKWWPGDGG